MTTHGRQPSAHAVDEHPGKFPGARLLAPQGGAAIA